MLWFWRFLLYSFLGFLLEVAFARAIRSPKLDRKCLVLLPLCPVYGFGAVLILWLARRLDAGPLGIMALGFVCATVVEYAMDLFYDRVLGVRFWDYTQLRFNLQGRVCLTFSLCWTGLALVLVYLLVPLTDQLLASIPAVLGPPALILLMCDGAVSCLALRRTGTTDVLRWYR